MDIFNVVVFLQEHGQFYCQEKHFCKKFPEYYKDISNIKFPDNFTFQQKLYHYFNNDFDLKLGICPICKKNRCKFISFGSGYKKHCSKKCLSIDKEVKLKRQNTIKSTPDFYKKRYEKSKETSIKKYGVENYSSTQECRNKVKETFIQRYGVENYSQTNDYKEKYHNACISKYGTPYFFQSNTFKEKSEETCLNTYGIKHYSQTKECREKMKQTCLEKYGVECSILAENVKQKVKQTCLEKYGTENYSQTNEFRDKAKKTCLEKYGVENYSQTKEWSQKRRKKIKYDNLMFDSSWEVMVYQYCKENNIPCEYQPNVKFEYTYNNKIHYYQPDFLINGKLYEVKGDHFFEGDKMICPYKRNDYIDELYEAKHQCMLSNNVIILREKDIIKLKEKL